MPSTTQSFRKEFIVFKCNVPRNPKCITRKEIDTMTRCFISDVLLDSTEEEIQQEIYEVLHNTGPKLIAPKGFKITDVNHIIGRVFNTEEGSKLSGCTIKQMVRTGAIYVRLLKHHCLIA